MRIIYRYLLGEVVSSSFAAIAILTSLIMFGDAFKRIAQVLVDNDIPFWVVLKMIALLSPQAMTITIPWGLLVGTLLVFGRMSHNREILIIRSAGLGLVPLIAPVVLFSMFMCMLSFYNNAILAPKCMTKFKEMIFEIGRNNPTMLIRAQEPIDKFSGYTIYVDKKYGNTIEGVYIWKLDPKTKIPLNSMRADKGILNADLQNMELTITLFGAREEDRANADPADLSRITTGIRASQLPIRVPLGKDFDSSRLTTNIGIMTAEQIVNHIFAGSNQEFRFTPLFTELQKRVSFSVACFTFMFLAIPLAITTGRAETSIGFVISVAIVVLYYLMIVYAMSLKDKPNAYPDLIIWIPNILFQGLGFWLIWRANKHPA
ncbi:MAG: LptF/LptG family permease [Verrucomicrobiales bacterium]|nr:LptF/LptG family permease [Verrucomicrobiales bacterium]